MKVLIIQVGTPEEQENYPLEKLIREPTLTHGTKLFRHHSIVNNVQTRESLKMAGVHIDYIYFTERKNPINCFKASLRLRKMVKQNGYDLVNQYWGGLSSLFASFFCPCPYVLSLMGSDLYGQYKSNGTKTWKGRMLCFFSQLTCFFATGVIVMSENMKRKLWTIARKKAIVIPEGISSGVFYPIDSEIARRHLSWDDNQLKILFFPSIAYVKNTPLAQAAFKKTKEILPSVDLFLAKDIPHAELVWYYNAADVLLLTSYHEGSNNSLKEALACNLPIVTVNVGDATERLENVYPSEVVKSHDAQDLAEKMVKILEERKRSNGSLIIPEVELGNVALRIVAFYKSLLKQPKAKQQPVNNLVK